VCDKIRKIFTQVFAIGRRSRKRKREKFSGKSRKTIKATLSAGDVEVIRAELIKKLDSISGGNKFYSFFPPSEKKSAKDGMKDEAKENERELD
jgi:hypothetical protein